MCSSAVVVNRGHLGLTRPQCEAHQRRWRPGQKQFYHFDATKMCHINVSPSIFANVSQISHMCLPLFLCTKLLPFNANEGCRFV